MAVIVGAMVVLRSIIGIVVSRALRIPLRTAVVVTVTAVAAEIATIAVTVAIVAIPVLIVSVISVVSVVSDEMN